MRRFSEDEVQAILDPAAVISALERAFAGNFQSTVHMPTRLQIHAKHGNTFLFMPCFDQAAAVAGLKTVAVRAQTPAGEPRIVAEYLLFDGNSGELQAVIAANYLTAIRTAGVSAVATRHLSRPDSAVLGIFGTGVQARSHMRILPLVRNFQRVLVCGSSPARSQKFAQEMSASLHMEVVPADATTCAQEADVICTCTNSCNPVFESKWVRAGTHLNLVGSFRPEMREVDAELLRRARVIVEIYEATLAEAGELIAALQCGAISQTDIIADLHGIVSGEKIGRQSAREISVFKSVGCAYEDLVVANLIPQMACSRGEAPE
jgi:ornithine cyclodeaminase/alanine dehydrogenase-like protein (mu-crystallin family)